MLLKSYYKAMALVLTGATGAGMTVKSVTGEEKPVSWDTSYFTAYKDLQKLSTIATSANGYGVCFGTGSVEPTLDDYCLSGSFISGLTVSPTLTTEIDNDTGEISCLYTITNGNASEITISEVAFVGYFRWKGYANQVNTMLDRTVLDTPVTIAAGGVGQVTYTIRMNYPT